MKILPNSSKIYYESKDAFKSEIDNVHAFPRTDFEAGMHMQEFFEINIITRGRGEHYIGDGYIETRAGDVFVIPPKLRHGFVGGQGFDVFHILISDKFMQKNMNDLQLIPSFFTLFNAEPIMRGKANEALHLRLDENEFETLNKFLAQTLEYRNQRDPFQCFARSGVVMIIISYLCKIYTQKIENKFFGESEKRESMLKVISYIHEHYYEKITVEDLMKIACLSRSTFIRRFSDVCKIPPSDYIMNRRLEAAEYMLLSTRCSLGEIASKTGFYDATHLSHTFKKQKGISPSEYRKKNAE